MPSGPSRHPRIAFGMRLLQQSSNDGDKTLPAGSETLPTLFDPRALYCNFLPKNRMAPDLLVSVTPPA